METINKIIEKLDQITTRKQTSLAEIPNFECVRLVKSIPAAPYNYSPSFYFVFQGKKKIIVEDETYFYKANQFLAISINIPASGCVVHGNENEPFLCIRLVNNATLAREVLDQLPYSSSEKTSHQLGLFVGQTTDSMQNVLLRLLELYDHPEDIDVLAPLYMRELYYYLLTSDNKDKIIQFINQGTGMERIKKITKTITDDFNKPLSVEQLAKIAGMSVSNFHASFKAATTMSPLQYQKKIRLLKAKQLLLSTRCTAQEAAFQVGYTSVSQFSREYSRFFGASPIKDVN